ncbi:MAG TPA: hypothetical protein VM432_00015 [Bdellovibrionales bacterium]|nr:hypothetical protein [Bdellovibrionales bacterium]
MGSPKKMVVAALLTADQRLSYQVNTWLKDVADSVALENYSDLDIFTQKIEHGDDEGANSGPKAEEVLDAEDIGSGKSSGSAKEEKFYRLLIVDLDLILAKNQTPLSWAKSIKDLLKSKGFSDTAFPTRLMFMAFEGGAIRPEALRHESVDDLILKPLDKSVFLQKVEILTADKPNISPTFLFRQKTEEMIEAGKDAMIDEVSDFAIAIRNPAPLAPGVFATIHCEIFGKAADARVIGRVYQSVKHPTNEGEWLVRFLYFGIRTPQLTNVKKFMRDNQAPGRFRAPVDAVLGAEPEVPFNRIAIIDMNPTAFEDVKSTVTQHYMGVEVVHFPSYTRFLAAIQKHVPDEKPKLTALPDAAVSADPAAAPAVTPATAAEPAAPETPKPVVHPWPQNRPSLSVLINGETLEFMKFETPLKPGDIVFSRTVAEWAERANDWFSGLDKDDQNVYQEMVDYAKAGSKGVGVLQLKDAEDNGYFLETSSSLAKSGDDGLSIVKIDIKEITETDWRKRTGQEVDEGDLPSAMKFDALFIDASFVKSDLEPWLEGLQQLMQKAQILNEGDKFPEIVITAEERSRFKPDGFRTKKIAGFFYKPLDRKIIGLAAKAILPELILREDYELAPFIPCEVPAKLAKDVFMSQVSEYGITIMHKSAFREGAYMRFFSPLLSATGEGVLGRCSFCEKSSDEKAGYACNFIFFGTADEVLKRIRTWIREDYVHSKEAGG